MTLYHLNRAIELEREVQHLIERIAVLETRVETVHRLATNYEGAADWRLREIGELTRGDVGNA